MSKELRYLQKKCFTVRDLFETSYTESSELTDSKSLFLTCKSRINLQRHHLFKVAKLIELNFLWKVIDQLRVGILLLPKFQAQTIQTQYMDG